MLELLKKHHQRNIVVQFNNLPSSTEPHKTSSTPTVLFPTTILTGMLTTAQSTLSIKTNHTTTRPTLSTLRHGLPPQLTSTSTVGQLTHSKLSSTHSTLSQSSSTLNSRDSSKTLTQPLTSMPTGLTKSPSSQSATTKTSPSLVSQSTTTFHQTVPPISSHHTGLLPVKISLKTHSGQDPSTTSSVTTLPSHTKEKIQETTGLSHSTSECLQACRHLLDVHF